MTRAMIRPYPTASRELVVLDGWDVFVNGVADPGPHLTHYTPTCEMTISNRAHLRVATIADECGIRARSGLALVAWWSCQETARRGSTRVSVSLDETEQVHQVVLAIPGRDLAGSLQLGLQLVVTSETRSARSGIDFPAGAIIWDSVTTLHLSGQGSQFPVEVVDFATARLPLNAAWHLDWHQGEWDRPLMGHVRLLINHQVAEVSCLATVEAPTPDQLSLLGAIQLDVATSLITEALGDEEFLSRSDWAIGSTGGVVETLIKAIFSSIDEAHRTLGRSRAEFSTRVQSTFFKASRS